MQAIDHLSDSVKDELKASVQDSSYHLFRGWKFADYSELREKLKVKSNPKIGSTFTLTTDKIRSWSKSKQVAQNFSNPKFDSIQGREFSDHEIHEMGYDHEQLLGVSILLEMVVDSEQVVADIENLPPVLMEHGHEEQEVIVDGGHHIVKVVDIKEFRHNSPYAFDVKVLNQIMNDVINQYNIKPMTFDDYCERFLHTVDDRDAAFLCLVFGFDTDSSDGAGYIREILDMRISDGDDETLPPKMLSNIVHYIRQFNSGGRDDLHLRNEWTYLRKAEPNKHNSGFGDANLGDWDADD